MRFSPTLRLALATLTLCGIWVASSEAEPIVRLATEPALAPLQQYQQGQAAFENGQLELARRLFLHGADAGNVDAAGSYAGIWVTRPIRRRCGPAFR
jgi:hypothetical protein